MSRRLLLDTYSLIYRAYFALPRTIVDAQQRPVNAVHGYLDMTARLATSQRPDEIVHVYDHDWRPEGRTSVYPGYKADRPPDPEALPPQFDFLRDALDALGATQAEAPYWEADDGIAALCAQAGPNERLDIVTGDRDLFALVRDPVVRVLFTVKGVSELAVFDEAAVLEKHGVPPTRYVEYAILRGDASDGLPGVKGVGEKTARALVAAYPDLDSMLADANADPPQGEPLARSRRLAESLRTASEYIEAMRSVVPTRADVEVRVWRGAGDAKRLDELAENGGLGGPIRRLGQAVVAPAED
ncbi:MAG: 5'-3' exonuclease [Chloroflexia bacterium]